jgi:hypothetical protein
VGSGGCCSLPEALPYLLHIVANPVQLAQHTQASQKAKNPSNILHTVTGHPHAPSPPGHGDSEPLPKPCSQFQKAVNGRASLANAHR